MGNSVVTLNQGEPTVRRILCYFSSLLFLFVCVRVSICSPSCLGTQFIDTICPQTHGDFPGLGLKVYAITLGCFVIFEINTLAEMNKGKEYSVTN